MGIYENRLYSARKSVIKYVRLNRCFRTSRSPRQPDECDNSGDADNVSNVSKISESKDPHLFYDDLTNRKVEDFVYINEETITDEMSEYTLSTDNTFVSIHVLFAFIDTVKYISPLRVRLDLRLC